MLISIGGQTDSAKDAVKRTEARQLITLAAFYASANNGSYEGVCASNTFIKGDGYRILKSIVLNASGGSYTVISRRGWGNNSTTLLGYSHRGGGGASWVGYCFDASNNGITDNEFALYFTHAPNTFGCVDSAGNVSLNLDRQNKFGRLIRTNKFLDLHIFSLSIIRWTNSPISCK